MARAPKRAAVRLSSASRNSRYALAVVDAIAKLALPTSMWLLVQGWSAGAVAAACTATAAAAARGFITGIAVEATLLDAWSRVMDAARHRPATELVHRDHGSEGAAMLLEAIEAESSHRATVVPRLQSLVFSVSLVVITVVITLGVRWLIAGAVLFAVMAALVRVAHRRVGAAHKKMVDCYGPLSIDLSVALDAALELRSQAAERFVNDRILRGAQTLASQRRIANTWSALLALLPLGVAALALAAPTQAGIGWVRQAVELHAPETGILGATAAVLGLGLARTLEQRAALRPARAKLEAFVQSDSSSPTEASDEERSTKSVLASCEDEPIVLRGVQHHYAGNEVSTPSSLDLTWPPRTGVAITGANGSGKSTLLLLLAGLLEPTQGTLSIGGNALSAMSPTDRAQLAFLPQAPFVAPDRSVEWHLRLTGYDGPSDAMTDALARVQLLASLEAHGKRHGRAPLDIPVSELSGGERSRLALARALLRGARFILLDEPEAGLDEEGRVLLKALLGDLARNARVAVVAHDPSVVPDGFAPVPCRRGGRSASNAAPSRKPS